MSYWVYLQDEGKSVTVSNHKEGGTHAVSGTTQAELNITYNYGSFYRDHLHKDGLKGLHDKKAKDCVNALACAVSVLGTERDDDYWANTPGNAGYALSILLEWARIHPEAVFIVH